MSIAGHSPCTKITIKHINKTLFYDCDNLQGVGSGGAAGKFDGVEPGEYVAVTGAVVPDGMPDDIDCRGGIPGGAVGRSVGIGTVVTVGAAGTAAALVDEAAPTVADATEDEEAAEDGAELDDAAEEA